jgi:hypothetical protein
MTLGRALGDGVSHLSLSRDQPKLRALVVPLDRSIGMSESPSSSPPEHKKPTRKRKAPAHSLKRNQACATVRSFSSFFRPFFFSVWSDELIRVDDRTVPEEEGSVRCCSSDVWDLRT